MPTNIFNVSQRLTKENQTASDESGPTNATTSIPPSVKLPSAATPHLRKPSEGGDGSQHPRPDGPSFVSSPEIATLGGLRGGRGKESFERQEPELGARNGLIAEEDEDEGVMKGAGEENEGLRDPYHDASDGKDRLKGRKPNSDAVPNREQSSSGVYSSDRQLTDSPSQEEEPALPSHDHSNLAGDQYDHQTRPPPSRPPSFAANAPTVPFRSLPGGGKRLHKNSFVELVRNGKSRSRDKSGSGESEEGGRPMTEQEEAEVQRKDFVNVHPTTQKKGPMSSPSSSSSPSRIAPQPVRSQTLPPASSPLKRTNSLPHSSSAQNNRSRDSRPAPSSRPTGMSRMGTAKLAAGSKWGNLKAKLQRTGTALPQEESKQAGRININDELMVGSLGIIMMKMTMDRDEKGRRRVPVFLHHIKFKVVDSIGGMGNHPIFRIECQYGDGPGAVKWVLYRNLRDFLSLHAHYKAAGLSRVTNRSTVKTHVEVPEFPKSSIPYFQRKKNGKGQSGRNTDDEREASAPPASAEPESQPMGLERGSSYVHDPRVGRSRRESVLGKLKGEKSDGGKTRPSFAKNQREALEDYLIGLVKAIMLRPEANRLIRFLEISALTLSLAQAGGAQGKSGYLRVLSSEVSKKSDRPMLASIAWARARKPRWWVVRESYLIAVDEPDQTDIFDVFPFDQDFTIERPKRALRRGAHKLEHWNDKARGDTHSIADSAVEAEARLAEIEGSVHGGGDRATITSQDADAEGRKENSSHHTFYVNNAQRRLKFVAKNVRQMQQFIVSLERMASESIWTGKNRFDSFAPIRLNVAAEWMVDARDYMWAVSRGLLEAKKCVYIHDWWLSPELYMRRPSQEKYRLDNILKKIAERGVKIHVIVYNEVSNKTTPTDSQYTKVSLRNLHPNIFVQRSPNHFNTGTFYWSHHEKMCVIDEKVAFMGGVDLCFGRWDTPQHALVDDDFEPNTIEGESGPIWPGKDYSNPRVEDFHTLNKPFEDQYDRAKVPRMPWHDIAMQMVGQPARDLCRHFIQRWNHLLRIKNHSQEMPFLVPPPDFTVKQLQEEGLTGTCEIQVCRSCGPWSMGTNNRIEHSIQNAYLKAIQLSEHFVYIENQFFITSTVVDGIVIENQIGDALVNRIIQAHEEGTPWRACIVIPLLPGYTYPVDSDQASSVRLILECQNKTICRGPNSIFSRLRQAGIDPDEYISFFSLRGWGKFKDGVLTTEMVYIHAKTMIVDDRVAIIGSANINERSMRGDRDSELASVIRDTDMIDSRMAGKPFQVGRFAHTLRMRLMREHLGIDVDAMEEDDLLARDAVVPENDIQIWDPDAEQQAQGEANAENDVVITTGRMGQMKAHAVSITNSVVHGQTHKVQRAAHRVTDLFVRTKQDLAHPEDDVEVMVTEDGNKAKGFASSVVPTMEERRLAEHNLIQGPLKRNTGDALGDIANIVHDQTEDADQHPVSAQEAKERLQFTSKTLPGDEATKIKQGNKEPLPLKGPGPGLHQANSQGDMRQAMAAAFGMEDDAGDQRTEAAANSATNSSSGTRMGERSGGDPSSLGRKKTTRKTPKTPWDMPLPTPKIDPDGLSDPLDEKFWKDTWVAIAVHNTEVHRKVFRCVPDDLVTTWAQYQENVSHAQKFNMPPSNKDATGSPPNANDPNHRDTHHKPGDDQGNGAGAGGGGSGGGVIGQGIGQQQLRDDVTHKGVKETNSMQMSGQNIGGANKPPGLSQAHEGWNAWEMEKMEELLGETRGHLVVYPTRFLEAEDLGNNFLFNSDRILPLPIYD